ncbi:hypothetical protein BDM02DRAFT_2747875 [Thelephora ganbajun]|uniref:Uncharacterized protein n=1 Tax=Thelephora ganbajun TaxID=370292 RepID=A0ACB6YY89_THEGA|nr:hypothetical protein BDM02DRAFT_2747875 [Thelephora ganbajun]
MKRLFGKKPKKSLKPSRNPSPLESLPTPPPDHSNSEQSRMSVPITRGVTGAHESYFRTTAVKIKSFLRQKLRYLVLRSSVLITEAILQVDASDPCDWGRYSHVSMPLHQEETQLTPEREEADVNQPRCRRSWRENTRTRRSRLPPLSPMPQRRPEMDSVHSVLSKPF